jgi:hypothetical protein
MTRLQRVKEESQEMKKKGLREEAIMQICLNRLKTYDEKEMFIKRK